MSTEPCIVVFDGVCVLCNGWVRFLLARDPHARFRFAAMQTPAGSELMTRHGLDPANPDSLLLINDGIAYTDTDAIRRILAIIGGPWRLIAWAMAVVPRPLRDPIYRLVARNRYRWFGKHTACTVPGTEERARFI